MLDVLSGVAAAFVSSSLASLTPATALLVAAFADGIAAAAAAAATQCHAAGQCC
jgi:hypothetical protein